MPLIAFNRGALNLSCQLANTDTEGIIFIKGKLIACFPLMCKNKNLYSDNYRKIKQRVVFDGNMESYKSPTFDDIRGVLLRSKHSGGKYLDNSYEIIRYSNW